jgi:DNA invertase Pin-like site-specific DNA recombinase
MSIFGYARVSTKDQSLASQDAQLRAAGCTKIYAEKISGARSDRPELAKLLKRLDQGDVLIVTRLDRLARKLSRSRVEPKPVSKSVSLRTS